MQELEIKDVQSGAVYRIAAQGSVIGREGAKADIIIKNPSVSKRHARIYADSGQWFLEDLGSSNGTFFANQRISEPVELAPGALFALAEIQFEVVKKPGGEDRGGRDRLRAATAARPDEGELVEKGANAKPSLSKRGGGNSDRNSGDRDNGKSSNDGEKNGSFAPDGDGDVATGVPAIMSALPRAFAYYLVEVPKMALNPIGTIRRGIEDQPHPPMSWWSLAGWGIPPMILVGLIGIISSVIVSVVVGGAGAIVGAIISAIITPAIYVAVALVGAFLFHPVMTFIIKLLKGSSDVRSRSNHFVMAMTSTALTGIATGVAVIFSIIPLPFIGIAPLVLSLAASLISLYLAYSWFKFYQVMKWVPIVMLVLMALSAVSAVLGIVGAVTGGAGSIAGGTPSIPTPSTPGSSDSPSPSPSEGTTEDAMKLAEAKVKAATEEATKVSDEAAKALQDAKAEHDPNKEKMKLEREKALADEARVAAEKAAQDAIKKASPTPEPSKSPEATKAPEPSRTPEAAVRSSGGFSVWANKRDAVEKAIKEDPLLLRKGDVARLYETYTKVAFEVRKNWNTKRSAKEPWRDKIIEHQTNGEIFEKTQKTIDELHAKLGL